MELNCNPAFSPSDLAQILIACASLIISFLAYCLAKKITFKKTIKDRQFEVVSEFVRAFSSSLVSVSWQNHGGGASLFYLSQMRGEKFMQNEHFLMFKTRLIIQEDGFNNFPFMPLIGDPFLPNLIYEELRNFYIDAEANISDPQAMEKYLIICNHKDYSNPNYWVSRNPNLATFQDFYNTINRVMDVTDIWLEQHGASELKFRNIN